MSTRSWLFENSSLYCEQRTGIENRSQSSRQLLWICPPRPVADSAVQVAVPFFPPTDFLSMDAFAAEHDLPQGFAYPHDAPTSPDGLLIECPGEVFPTTLLSIQDCPDETEAADPTSYVRGREVPMWILHGLADTLPPFNQSELVYDATTAEGNRAR